jgi:hypothetical protein
VISKDDESLRAEAEAVMQPQLRSLRLCAKPAVFDTGIPGAHFSVAGTLFLVGFHQKVYVLTPRHVVLDWPMDGLAIILTETGERLPLSTRWIIRVHDDDGTVDEDSDMSDLIIFRADLTEVSPEARSSNYFVHLTPPEAVDWFDSRDESIFFLYGHPKVANYPDWERSKVIQNQYLLHGAYAGPSPFDGCFELSIENPLALADFDGLSGSPVFSLLKEYKSGIQPVFCGMALRGTAPSKRIHFLGANIIIAALEEAHASELT